PNGSEAVTRLKSAAPPAWKISETLIRDRSRLVLMLARTVGARPLRRNPGSAPSNAVNGAPDCNVRKPLTCQPPNRLLPNHPPGDGSSHTPFTTKRCGRSKEDRPRSGRRLNGSCAMPTSPETATLVVPSEELSIKELQV